MCCHCPQETSLESCCYVSGMVQCFALEKWMEERYLVCAILSTLIFQTKELGVVLSKENKPAVLFSHCSLAQRVFWSANDRWHYATEIATRRILGTVQILHSSLAAVWWLHSPVCVPWRIACVHFARCFHFKPWMAVSLPDSPFSLWCCQFTQTVSIK